jgi:hypothetical protein
MNIGLQGNGGLYSKQITHFQKFSGSFKRQFELNSESPDAVLYELIAVVHNTTKEGNALKSHFISFVNVNETWLCCNDSQVSEVDFDEDVHTSDTSMLMYRKMSAWDRRKFYIIFLVDSGYIKSDSAPDNSPTSTISDCDKIFDNEDIHRFICTFL